MDGKEYNYTLWDTAGQEAYEQIRVLCYNQVRRRKIRKGRRKRFTGEEKKR